MTRIKLSPEAKKDLKETGAYITNELHNSKAAGATVSRIMKRLRSLADFPEIGAPLSSKVHYETDLRFLVCGNYTAFYQYENNLVYVVRILYGGRDFTQILFGEPEND